MHSHVTLLRRYLIVLDNIVVKNLVTFGVEQQNVPRESEISFLRKTLRGMRLGPLSNFQQDRKKGNCEANTFV